MFPSLMVERYFGFVMMTLGGGRAIITLRAIDRDRGRRSDCQRSWEVTCRHFILYPFTLQVAECKPWQAVCDDVQDLLTSINGPDKHIWIVYVGRPNAI